MSRDLLFDPQAFEITLEPTESREGVALERWRNNANQACLNMFRVEGPDIEQRLQGTGVLVNMLSRAVQDTERLTRDDTNPLAVASEILLLIECGEFDRQLTQLPRLDVYKLRVLRRLGRFVCEGRLSVDARMALNLRMAELQVISDGYLADLAAEIERTDVETFVPATSCVWQNYYLYRCYHEVFPGATPDAYASNFLEFTVDYFCLRSLLAILINAGIVLADDTLAALFSAWYRDGRQAVRLNEDTEPLLVGLSLLSRAGSPGKGQAVHA